MDELLIDFLTETNEAIEIVDNELLRFELNPNDKAVLDNIFRLVHTVKGTCGFIGLPRLEAIAHAAENVLGKIRDGKLATTSDTVTCILQSIDCIKYILASLNKNGLEPEGNDKALIAKLNHIAGFTDEEIQRIESFENVKNIQEVSAIQYCQADGDINPNAKDDHSKNGMQNIRVSVSLLENLMTLVSELVLTRNQLTQLVRKSDSNEFAIPVQRLSQCTTELQEGIMKTRMQPIGNAWSKLPRIIRDLSQELGKKITLDLKGEDTELDRQVLEMIKDPLTHMVRNSADHGIETPEARRLAGKSETGHIRLNAYHEGGHIVIEIADDGRGLNLEKLRNKAVEAGLVSEADAENLSDNQIQKFIFHPGLSTADAVTSISGRGVGMDVVRANIEKISGKIDVLSQPGRGTKFSIKIPLTLAIVSALIIESGGERFAIPQISVLELVRAASDSENRIEKINETPVLRLRNRLLPLVFMNSILGLRNKVSDSDEMFIVVSQVGAFIFGIVVDQVYDTEEIVVKPVAPILKNIPVYSGNTILGDGSVIMILDPNGIANLISEQRIDDEEDSSVEDTVKSSHNRESMLIFSAGNATPKAVPLSLVARLEDVLIDTIEYSEGKPTVQYRNKMMPLLFIDQHGTLKKDGRQPLLVFNDADLTMALVVDEILDIIEAELEIDLSSERNGRVGSAIISGRVTEIIDVGHYFKMAFKEFLKRPAERSLNADVLAKNKKLLLVDDSTFFQTMLKPILIAAGYEVTTAPDVRTALKLREDGEVFNIIISDIEMPGQSGFDFAQTVREGGLWSEIPMIALSSLNQSKDIERGRLSGFNDYVAKFDRDSLLSVIEHQIKTHAEAA